MTRHSINTACFLSATIVALALTGCLATEDDFEASQHEIVVWNGVATYDLTYSGLRSIDSSYGGLKSSSLAGNGSWASWMAADPSAEQTFSYLVGCALGSNQSISAVTVGGVAYGPWTGQLGLAPKWANSGAQSQAEQELVTACMLARFNPSGAHVLVSARSIEMTPPSAAEFAEYPLAEAQFFGNLFTATPVMAACRADGANAATDAELTSSQRYCAVDPAQCGFIDYGTCSEICSSFDNYQGVFGACLEYETVATFISTAS